MRGVERRRERRGGGDSSDEEGSEEASAPEDEVRMPHDEDRSGGRMDILVLFG